MNQLTTKDASVRCNFGEHKGIDTGWRLAQHAQSLRMGVAETRRLAI